MSVPIVALGEIAKVTAGNSAPQEEKAFLDGVIPFIRTSDVGRVHIGPISDSTDKLPLSSLPKFKLIPPDSILFPKSGASTFLNHRAITTVESVVSSHLAAIIPDKRVCFPLYLFYALLRIDAKELIQDQGYPSLNLPQISAIEIPLPNLEVQREIASKITQELKATDALRAVIEQRLETIHGLKNEINLQILKKFEGELTPVTLSEVATYQNGKAHEKIVDENGAYELVNSKFISSNGTITKRVSSALCPLFAGDVAIVLSDVPNGKALAKCFLVDEDSRYSLNQRIAVIRSEKLTPEFLFLLLNRNEHLLSFNNGENQTNLRLNDVLETPLFLTSKNIQNEIVSESLEASAAVQTLEEIYKSLLVLESEFRSSLIESGIGVKQ